MKLTGIIEDVFRGVTIFRGYATLKTLARLSASTSYQRDKDPDRIDAIKDYISNSSYVFYPELILGWQLDNPDAILPRISFNNRTHNNRDSRAWMINAKYVRLKNVEIGYTINKPKLVPLLNYVRFYVSGQNLLTFADFKGNDPEAPGTGLDLGMRYPMTRVYNFGVQVNF